jgi:CheY-like chemotaxis protein
MSHWSAIRSRLGGFDVLEAATGGQALAVLANGHAVAAVVSDIRMPVMDGVDSGG